MLQDIFEDPPSKGTEAPPTRPKNRPRRFQVFLLVPILFLLLLGLIVYLFGLISFDTRSPLDLIREVRITQGERRLLAAMELSRLEEYDLPEEEKSRFLALTLQTYDQEEGGDPGVRQALALTLGRVGSPTAVPPLLRSLKDPDVETQLYSTWALGAIGDPVATEPILPLLHHPDPGVRKMAAFALGQIGDSRASDRLELALKDDVPDVTWNAAVALTRLGNEAGLPILLPLLDRRELESHHELDPRRQEELLITIIRSLRGLSGQSSRQALSRVAEEDPSARIRSEARMALEGRPAIFPILPP